MIFGHGVLGHRVGHGVGHGVFSGSSLATLWFSGLNGFLGNF
jgi:hypothetical protein